MAQLRMKMLTHLESQDVPRWVEHKRAIKVFARRLEAWSGASRIEKRSASVQSLGELPVLVDANPIELLIVRAIISQSGVGLNVAADGAPYLQISSGTKSGFVVTVKGLSPLLDQVAQIYRQITWEQTGFIEAHGQFITTAGVAFADLRPYSKQLGIPPDPHPTSIPEPVRELTVFGATGIWQSHGVLGSLGYRVGRRGLSRDARRRVLAQAIAVKLIPGTPFAHEYVTSWGEPDSQVRIDRMRDTIEGFSAKAESKWADYSKSIADWREDLTWLESMRP